MSAPTRSSPVGRWVGLALGAPLVAVGVAGVLREAPRTHPGELARWVVGAALLHDLVVLPVVSALVLLVGRRLPAAVRPAVAWAGATAGVLALIGWPFVRGYGRSAGNPSLLPRAYGTGLAVAVGLVALTGASWALLARRGRAAAVGTCTEAESHPS